MSLSHLAQLETDCAKIDKVFVETVGTDAATSEVAMHLIRVAQSLRMALIGEGIATEAQADFLRRNGVEYGQGWLCGKAVPMLQLPGEAGDGLGARAGARPRLLIRPG